MEFHDLNAQYRALKPEIDGRLASVLATAHFIGGSQVQELEEKLAAYVGRKHCVSCANGTDALVLGLMAWNIGEGDAVYTADFTYFASASCACAVGATPIPVDISPLTFNIDPDALEAAIQKTLAEGKLRPAVIIPVDLFGQPADYTRIEPIAAKYGLRILEDAAQGFGGSIGKRRACAFGEMAATSFFPAKPLGCYGDGGAIFTDDDEIDALLRSLRAQGRSPQDKYDNRMIGRNSRLDTLQAAVLIPKLTALEKTELDALNRIAKRYTKKLKHLVTTPTVLDGFSSSWAQYTVRLCDAAQRNALKAFLQERGIPSMVYYPRGMHQQTAFSQFAYDASLYPHTVAMCEQVLSLPMHPYLTEQDQDAVCEAIAAFFSGND